MMLRSISFLALVLVFCLVTKAEVAQHLQDISVTIRAGGSEGSGVIVVREIDGEKVNFIWTAAHVVRGLRHIDPVIDPLSGTNRQLIKFRDAEIIKELVEDGRRVGELKMDAKVVRYSSTQDIALLMVRKRELTKVVMLIPTLGTSISTEPMRKD